MADNDPVRNICIFLTNHMNRVDEEAGSMKSLQLVHLGIQKESELWSMEGDFNVAAMGLAEEIYRIADQDAEGMGGIQKYAVKATYSNGKKRGAAPVHRFRIVHQEEMQTGLDAADSEPANSKGIVVQLMRHNEALTRMALQHTVSVAATQSKLIDRLTDRLDKMETDRFEMIQQVEEMLTMKHERELAGLIAKKKEERIDAGIETGRLLLPAVVNRLTGTKLLPEKASAFDIQVKSICESITEEQLKKIGEIFTEDQFTILLDLMERTAKGEDYAKNTPLRLLAISKSLNMEQMGKLQPVLNAPQMASLLSLFRQLQSEEDEMKKKAEAQKDN